MSSAVTALAVLLNYLVPGKVFLYVMSVALMAGILNWMLVMVTQWCFRRRIGARAQSLNFRLPLFPVANVVVLLVLAAVVVEMARIPSYRTALYVGPAWVAIVVIAYVVRRARARSLGRG